MYQDLEARDTNKRREALSRLQSRMRASEPRAAEMLKNVLDMRITDKLVAPLAMLFVPYEKPDVRLCYQGTDHDVAIHKHALRQMAAVANPPIPLVYVSRLLEPSHHNWRTELLCKNFNETFHCGEYLDRKKQPARFLHRLVGPAGHQEIRGFLSRSFNRKLRTAELIKPFVETCMEFGAGPAETIASDIRVDLKYVLPVVFEPIDGEFIAFGVTYLNSDFGAGKQRICGTCMRISSGTTSVMEDALSRVHLGSLIEDSDLELSEETEDKELETYKSAVRDSVRAQFKPENIDKVLKAIRLAHEHEIPWHRLKTSLAKVLQKAEISTIEDLLTKNGGDIIDLPPLSRDASGDATANAWWIANTLGWMATRESDPERRMDIQALAGTFVGSISK